MRTYIQEPNNHLIRICWIELNWCNVLIIWWRLKSSIQRHKLILSILSCKGIDIDLTICRYGHVFIVSTEGTSSWWLYHMREDDFSKAICSPYVNLPTNQNYKLSIRTGLYIIDISLCMKIIFFQLKRIYLIKSYLKLCIDHNKIFIWYESNEMIFFTVTLVNIDTGLLLEFLEIINLKSINIFWTVWS